MAPGSAFPDSDRRVVLGRIVGVFGVRGWVKVLSETEPLENILTYSPWLLSGPPGDGIPGGVIPGAEPKASGWRVVQSQRHRKGLIVRLKDCDDRDQAQTLVGAEIAVQRSQLPPPAVDEFYWTDLEGLSVETIAGDSLGVVDHLLATGANDVLVIRGERERLIPFVWDRVIRELDFERGRISVDWDPDF
ncbi:ribosome maturation factor RimM [Thiorhodovibrio frisius]|uniref:Ribosome maturation factor RimM n=1 Tax=Thiorhodovibrio frisius TaxID=631362 RepID=H8YZR2_9GAMM|nr:ribosome maturation factor RimM [Thiorhodovibrio frisius]EIC22189.1 16S rRNA processing protein RimM [Thiorhodovibrio frisius]WPL24483.1 Ribosome maturation factor RimM [Thiorhodovibrio frisius]